jgi:hypothetical protein
MFPFDWFSRRKALKVKAESLLQRMGSQQAMTYLVARACDPEISDEEQDEAVQLRRAIKKKLGLSTQTDTATRYLEQ